MIIIAALFPSWLILKDIARLLVCGSSTDESVQDSLQNAPNMHLHGQTDAINEQSFDAILLRMEDSSTHCEKVDQWTMIFICNTTICRSSDVFCKLWKVQHFVSDLKFKITFLHFHCSLGRTLLWCAEIDYFGDQRVLSSTNKETIKGIGKAKKAFTFAVIMVPFCTIVRACVFTW